MRSLVAGILALVVMWPMAVFAQSGGVSGYEEGRHYRTLAEPVATRDPAKIEVVELFWYGCPYCYQLEPLVKEWREKLLDDVDFRPLAASMNKSWEVHARTFYAAEAMGIEEQIRQPLFEALVRDRRPLNDLDSLAKFVGELGFDEQRFRGSYNSFSVSAKVKQANESARKYRVSGVPAMVINGKYVIDAGGVGLETMLKVADYLIAKERQYPAS